MPPLKLRGWQDVCFGGEAVRENEMWSRREGISEGSSWILLELISLAASPLANSREIEWSEGFVNKNHSRTNPTRYTG